MLAEAASTEHDRESAELESRLLASHVTGRSRASLFAFPEAELTAEQSDTLQQLLQRRCQGEPLAYITGQREFWSLPLSLAAGALIPRPDTELLVDLALQHLPGLPPGDIFEPGTGSGAIALALAQEITDRPIVAIERHSAALQVAHDNIRQFGQGRVQLIQANWLDCIATESAAMIVSNPPYLASDDPHLPTLQYEPHTALVSGTSGLEDIELIIEASCRVGKPGCLLLLEHGNEQGSSVRSLLENYNFEQIQTCRDLSGHERVSLGYREGLSGDD